MENVAAASSAAAEKSPFPVHSFNSPCPSIRSVSSGPTPPLSSSSSCRSVSIYNPFDENIDERLRHSVYSPAFGTCGPITTCSTWVFGGGHHSGSASKVRRRSIDTMAILNPVDIDLKAARRQGRAKFNSELDANIQKSLTEFYASTVYDTYSPSSRSSDTDSLACFASNGRENAAAAAAADGGARDDNTLENDLYCDHATQTVLTIPKHIDLTKLLGHLHSYDEKTEDEEMWSPGSDVFPMPTAETFSSSSPLRRSMRSNPSSSRKNHCGRSNLSGDLGLEYDLSLNDDDDCNNDGNNKSRSSSLGNDRPEELCVSPILFTPDIRRSSNFSKLPSGAKLSSSPSPKNSLQGCPTSPIPHPVVSHYGDDVVDEVFEPSAPQLTTSSNTNAVRFLSVTSEEDNLSEAASEHHTAHGTTVNEENDDAAAVVSLEGVIDDAAVSFEGRLESTREIIFEDVGMLSSIRNTHDTMMLTAEDSGFIGSGGNRDQRFAPALSSTRIGFQFHGGGGATTVDSGCSNSGTGGLSQEAVINNSQEQRSSGSNHHGNYREPIAEAPSVINITQNSFVLDEGSRDTCSRSCVNAESSAMDGRLDTTSAGIRDQFQDFGLLSPLGMNSSQQKDRENHSPRANLTPLAEPRTKLPRTTGTPDLSSFQIGTPLSGLFGEKSFRRELFNTRTQVISDIDTNPEASGVHGTSNSITNCSSAERITRGSVRAKLKFGENHGNENASQAIPSVNMNLMTIPLSDRTNQDLNDSPQKPESIPRIVDTVCSSANQSKGNNSTNKSVNASKPVRKAARRTAVLKAATGGSLSDVLHDPWWDCRINKHV